ncbi:MAG: TIGR00730 family Rossman fold protein [Opitutales bacterium]|nr:TIGR00730 family Rossman fold protein [Opitutales bacterium]MCH8540701.1 TIGR00730 family Rossman fold protein [Opitutales bacterium]
MSENPKSVRNYTTAKPEIDEKIRDLLKEWGVYPEEPKYFEMIVTILKMASDNPHPADVLLFNRMMKEVRYANRVFQPYRATKKISVFGSARTLADCPTYQAAYKFGEMMRERGFMVITGGGEGIMGAAQAGAGREHGFALNIELPFEQRANKTIDGDHKLINFKYFFTRKLQFLKNSDAIALFPGGFGTIDEGFETLTLMQTGKAQILPTVMVDEPHGSFWRSFDQYIKQHLIKDGLISRDDLHLFKITDSLEEACREVVNFYYNFVSYRFVRDICVLRLKRQIPEGGLVRLQDDFQDILIGEDPVWTSGALPEEAEETEIAELPRLCIRFNRRAYGRLRQLIDRVNMY